MVRILCSFDYKPISPRCETDETQGMRHARTEQPSIRVIHSSAKASAPCCRVCSRLRSISPLSVVDSVGPGHLSPLSVVPLHVYSRYIPCEFAIHLRIFRRSSTSGTTDSGDIPIRPLSCTTDTRVTGCSDGHVMFREQSRHLPDSI
jgi:hypothetical protein